jgi:hypothetical protein
VSDPTGKNEGPSTLRLTSLAGAGFVLVGNVIAGFLIGLALAKWLHWSLAIPIFVVLGFVSGFVAMYRQITRLT